MILDEFYKFSDIYKNIRTLKSEYNRFLCPFFDADKIREWRGWCYGLEISKKMRNDIWEVLNGDVDVEVFCEIYKNVI